MSSVLSRDLARTTLYSSRGLRYEGSPIDELRSLESGIGDVISFSHGSPSADALSPSVVAEISERLFRTEGDALLNYGPGEGDAHLRELIARLHQRDGVPAAAENVLVTSGATQGFDLVLKLLAEPGDAVLVEDPSYPNHLSALRNYGLRLIPVPMDEDGIVVDRAAAILDEHPDASRAKLMYLQPNFQNPTGVTLSAERRQALVELAVERGFVILEDDPYGELRFEGERLPPVMSLDDGSHVISFGCFSKTVAPGLRVGWVCGGSDFIERLLSAKMLADIHTPLWPQRIISELIDRDLFWPDVARRVEIWRRRRDAMLAALEAELAGLATWTEPGGGWFTWITFASEVDTHALLETALREGVSFVPGVVFSPLAERTSSARLCYTYAPEEDIEPGVRALRAALESHLRQRHQT